MPQPIIEVENLSKLYHLGVIGATTLKDSLERWWMRLSGKESRHPMLASAHGKGTPRTIQAPSEPAAFWALKNVSFTVNQGQIVGIIGRNGAGKSTLLKILSRITEPTEGKAILRGKVSSLLEVGTGFHQELTGRENIYLNGAILGMRKNEIDRKFDEIVGFAEIDKFIDTPVKHYSSGMYVRLAFAVAAHLEPEILLIDEVLAVGDVAFQKKCLGKMGEVAKSGRTVLFVSHNMTAIRQLTQSAVLIQNGKILSFDSTEKTIDCYLKTTMANYTHTYDLKDAPRHYSWPLQEVKFISAEMENHHNLIHIDKEINIFIKVLGNKTVDKFRFSIFIFHIDGTPIGGSFGEENLSITQGEIASFKLTLRNHHLAPGKYHCALATGKRNNAGCYFDFDVVFDVLHFEILSAERQDGAMEIWQSNWGPILFTQPVIERIE